MKKTLINLTKVIMVFSILFSQFTPVISVVADTIITSDNIVVDFGNDENQVNIKVNDSLLDTSKNYKLSCNISFYYADGTKGEGFDFVRENVSGSNLSSNEGYLVISDLKGAMDNSKHAVRFPNYKNGYCLDGICYNGKFVFEANIIDGNNTIGNIKKDIVTFNKDTKKVVYTSYQIDSNAKEIMSDNSISITDNSPISDIKVYGYVEDLNLNKNNLYKISGNGYAFNQNLTPKQIMTETFYDYNFNDKIYGKYKIINNYILNEGSKVYESTLNINYGDLDSYLSIANKLTFNNNRLIIEPVYNGSALTYQDIYNHVYSKFNDNYLIQIYDDKGNIIDLSNYDSNALTSSKVVIEYNGYDKNIITYKEEYKIINKYDYNNDGITTYEDLDKAINEKLISVYSINSTLEDTSFNGLTNNDLRLIQKNINNYSDASKVSDIISIYGDNMEVYNGDEVAVTFKVKDLTNGAYINNIAGDLVYDQNILSLKEVKINKNYVGSINNNKFYYAFYDKISNEDVVTFVFDTLASTDETGTVVSITNGEIGQDENTFSLVNYNSVNVKVNKSNDATLSSLTANDNLIDFDKNKLEYNVTIGTDVDKLNLSFIKNNKNATVVFDESTNGDYQVGVTKTLVIKVTAEDGVTVNEYKINVTKVLSSDNKLNNLYIDDNNISFNPNVNEYNVIVGSNIESLNIIPSLNDTKAHYYISGNNNFKSGFNTVLITVIAEDGTFNEYIINVFKESEETANLNNNKVEKYQRNSNDNEITTNETETNLKAADSKKNKKSSKKESKKDDSVNKSQVVIIILIILVIGGLIYLIFKDNDDDDTPIKPVDNKSKSTTNNSKSTSSSKNNSNSKNTSSNKKNNNLKKKK